MNALQKNTSRACRLVLAVVGLLALAPPAAAQRPLDRVRRHNGVDSGEITAVTPLGLTISKGGVESTIPAEDIESVTFAGEPAELNSARNAIQAGRPQEAADLLAKIPEDAGRREEISADVDFYASLAKTQLALAGQGPLDAATADVRGFLARRGKSFHIPAAIELLGDLLSAAGQHAAARAEYAKLAKAKSPYFVLRSALLVGRAWQAEGDHAQALAEFDKVAAATDAGELIEPLKLSATLDRAVSQAAGGKVDEATAAIAGIIAKASADDASLLARAYNALGDCYKQSGDHRGALYAFLHVDLLYAKEPEAHAKALHELVGLWKTAKHADRSQEAAAELAKKYPTSRWAKLDAGGGS
jgi:tetratricopeptide (TPR) repeat protein